MQYSRKFLKLEIGFLPGKAFDPKHPKEKAETNPPPSEERRKLTTTTHNIGEHRDTKN